MEKLEFKQLLDVEPNIIDQTTGWMYQWWGKREGYSLEEIRCYMEHSMQQDRLPQTYGLFLGREIIGMYQFTYSDFTVRPDIYPWLANVYIDGAYRDRGYGRSLLKHITSTAQEKLFCFEELFLYTEHIGLYEKFGFVFVSDFDTFSKTPRIQRLYKLVLKQQKAK